MPKAVLVSRGKEGVKESDSYLLGRHSLKGPKINHKSRNRKNAKWGVPKLAGLLLFIIMIMLMTEAQRAFFFTEERFFLTKDERASHISRKKKALFKSL